MQQIDYIETNRHQFGNEMEVGLHKPHRHSEPLATGGGWQRRRNLPGGTPTPFSHGAASGSKMAQSDGRRWVFVQPLDTFVKRSHLKTLFMGFAMLVTFASCNNEESNIQTEIKIPVSVTIIKPQSISRFIETTGTVYSSKEGSIKSELTGLYRLQTNPATGRPFALGDAVRAGQVIIRLEDREFENNLQLDGKRLSLEVSENNLNKQKSLFEKGGVTQTELNQASIDYVNAKYNYENAEIQKAKMFVKAPFTGVIVSIPYHTDGVRIDQGQELFKVMEYEHLLMDVKLPEKHLPEVTLNQLVQITNYNMAKDTIVGKISQISPVIDTETRTFQSVLQINNDKKLLRPGMFIKAAILSEQRDSTIVIPKETIISRQDGKVVFTVENGIATETKITTGLENQDVIEVLSGLKLNDRLVVTGFETLRNKSKVSVIQ